MWRPQRGALNENTPKICWKTNAEFYISKQIDKNIKLHQTSLVDTNVC